MRQNQPMHHDYDPQEQFVEIHINDNEEHHSSSTLINQTGTSNRTNIIIIISVIFVLTGKSIARLLETFHYHHTNRSLHVFGFPPLILPFFLLRHNQLLITADRTSFAVLYLCTGVIMLIHVKGNLESLLLDGTQLYLTLILSCIVKKIKFNLWIVISLIFTIAAVAITTLSSKCEALLSAVTFSFLLCNIQSIFNNVIVNCNKRKVSFGDVLELVIFSSLFAAVATVFVSGEKHDMKRDMDGFSKGKIVYVLTVVGQVATWQVYWVGIVGVVVFAEYSIVTANVISFSTYPIVKALRILFCN